MKPYILCYQEATSFELIIGCETDVEKKELHVVWVWPDEGDPLYSDSLTSSFRLYDKFWTGLWASRLATLEDFSVLVLSLAERYLVDENLPGVVSHELKEFVLDTVAMGCHDGSAS